MNMVAWDHIVRTVSSMKNLNMTENSGIDAKVVEFGQMLKLLGGNFWMVIFCDLYSRELKYP
jgi:hypothetical protein